MIGLLVITHGTIGASLLREAENALGPMPMPYALIELEPDDNVVEVTARARHAVKRIKQTADQILLLTDLYGATPSNIAHQLEQVDAIIHGVNLAMMLKVANYTELPLDELSDKALSGGKQAIFSGASPDD